ncbi:uncharacterized protein RSE6_14970 [Rhynchosporium secalis]|uniref:2EXR domain-containing protein n=1 Tax=Rhynchosporium secalis TaxID=38038 RepID=A0A1E1MWH1_RHYSE|nr:uncharacterized protein RSE6_14970 [Rhynchosporium secalis]
MSPANSFTLFGALPPELRLQIWREALSVRTVWAAIRNRASMAYIGSALYLAGLSCKEARRLLEQTYIKPICQLSADVCWVDMNHTVVYLGDFFETMTVIDSFHADDLCRFKHVALRWSQFDRLARVCRRLAATCPALCTIVIHQTEPKAQPGAVSSFSRSLSHKTAIDYAIIFSHNNSALGYEGLDTDYLRSLLLAYFGASPPRLHMLPPDLAES